MKRKALVVALLCVMGLAAISVSNAEAGGWYTCQVTQAGAATYGYFITLIDTASTKNFDDNTMFYIDQSAGCGKEMLAAALTAWANGGNVYIYLSSPSAWATAWAIIATK